MDSSYRHELRQMLTSGGMPVWRVRRVLNELDDHYRDIRDEALSSGLTLGEAQTEAKARMGKADELCDMFLSNDDLCDWPISMQLADAVVIAGDFASESTPIFARWSLAILASAIGTLTFLFGLHIILFG